MTPTLRNGFLGAVLLANLGCGSANAASPGRAVKDVEQLGRGMSMAEVAEISGEPDGYGNVTPRAEPDHYILHLTFVTELYDPRKTRTWVYGREAESLRWLLEFGPTGILMRIYQGYVDAVIIP